MEVWEVTCKRILSSALFALAASPPSCRALGVPPPLHPMFFELQDAVSAGSRRRISLTLALLKFTPCNFLRFSSTRLRQGLVELGFKSCIDCTNLQRQWQEG